MTATTPFAVGLFEGASTAAFVGLVVAGDVVRIDEVGLPDSIEAVFADWDGYVAALQPAADRIARGELSVASLPLDELRPLPPVPAGVQLFCAGANYRQHVAQMVQTEAQDGGGDQSTTAAALAALDEQVRTGRPYVWVGSARALSGARDDIVLPALGTKHDWELELAVVIGRRARHVPRERALDVVAGYTICNDLTTRDRVLRPDIPGVGTDWFAGKCAPSFFPIGPYVVPAAHVGDPSRLRIELTLNGELMQDSMTDGMTFDVAALIEYTSSVLELAPGDVILTGSPPGNGSHHARFLRPGDIVEGAITSLGGQRNRCVAETAADTVPVRLSRGSRRVMRSRMGHGVPLMGGEEDATQLRRLAPDCGRSDDPR
jgi:2-keto-4-pentenoate hydratase/2-oxohepta-3-ene-1,7-dioic acid hydratase in catechol pathway